MLNNDFINQYKTKTPPWGPVGYITYKRTYARLLPDGTTEEWWQTVARCVNGVLALGLLTPEEGERLYDKVFNLKCSFSGRSLWQLGTNNVKRFGGDSLQNCWLVTVDSPITPFCFTFEQLMLGGGVGFNILPENVYALPLVKHKPIVERTDNADCDFIVPDNREGWVKLLKKTLSRYFFSGKPLRYSTQSIRPKGRKIESFGGQASGSEELVKGIDLICKVLDKRVGQKLRPIDCLDIMNIIAMIVVSGNVRRSAQLALGHPKDSDFLIAKDWSRGELPNWRAMSNNSVAVERWDDLTFDFWEGYDGSGEAYGIVNLKSCREFGRIGDWPKPDYKVQGVNPCAEITLESYEACNLVEIFLPNLDNVHEFKEVAGLMYKVAKSITTLPFLYKETQKVVEANRRLGIGVTGIMQSKFTSEDFNKVYGYIEDLDQSFSAEKGLPTSKKLTTVKPSGTLSLLAGVTPGIHPAYSRYYIRRIRMAANDPLVKICKSKGYPVEPALRLDGSKDLQTMVVSFYVKSEGTTADQMTAIDQLEKQLELQSCWADNSVSCTIYYEHSELPEIQTWLAANFDKIKTTSFMLKSNHGFLQAPYESITEEEYNNLKLEPITSVVDDQEITFSESLECGSGGCPVR